MKLNVELIKTHKVAFISLVCVAALVIGGGIFGGIQIKNHYDSILPENASFKGISLSKMNIEQVTNAINSEINAKISEKTISFSFNEQTHEISPKEYNFSFNAEEVFIEAKKHNFKDDSTDIDVAINYDAQKLAEYFSELEAEVRVDPTTYRYSRVENNIIAVPGIAGITFNKEQASTNVVATLQTLEFKEVTTPEEKILDDTMKIDFDAIHTEIQTEMKDATSAVNDAGTMIYTDPVQGVDFDVEAAKKMLETEQEEYIVPLVLTQPKVTVEQLKEKHRTATTPDLLSTYTTYFSQGDQNRNFNIARAAAKINGTILQPGEAFSFHGIVQGTGKAQGYKESTVYTPKGMEKGYGGGVCQVSSTMYLAAIYANMDITERRNHSYTVTYTPLGFDAAVSDGGQNLKFKNSRKNPVKIVAEVTGSSITMSIYGIKLAEEDYQVTMTSETIETRPSDTKYEDDPTKYTDQQKTISNGQPGYLVYAYKTVKLNGAVVSEKKITSSYKPLPKIISVGTMVREGQTTPPATSSEPPVSSDIPSSNTTE